MEHNSGSPGQSDWWHIFEPYDEILMTDNGLFNLIFQSRNCSYVIGKHLTESDRMNVVAAARDNPPFKFRP